MGLQHQTCSTDVNSGSVLKCYECGLKKNKNKKQKQNFVLAAVFIFFYFFIYIIFVLVFHQSAPYSVLIQAPLLKLLQ